MEYSASNADDATTILKVLANDICRSKIMDYVPIRSLVRSETVCKEWQYAVNQYLEHRCALTLDISRDSRIPYLGSSHRIIKLPDNSPPSVFRKTIKKLGPSIVGVSTDRCDKEFLVELESICLDLQHLELKNAPEMYQNDSNIIYEEMVKFEGLTYLKFNKLKSLSVIDCQSLGFVQFHLCSYLQNITKLELDGIPIGTLMKANFLLDKMPKVEIVTLRCQNEMFPLDRDDVNEEFIECFSRLSSLRRLKMIMNHCVYNELLEVLARGCKRLEYLHIAGSGLVKCKRGLAALICRAPGAVTTLNFIQDVHPKERKDILKDWEAYGCEVIDPVGLQGQMFSLKFKLGSAGENDMLPGLNISIDSLRLYEGELEFEVLEERDEST